LPTVVDAILVLQSRSETAKETVGAAKRSAAT
jgi:hypothetical protein